MNAKTLTYNAHALVTPGKGILAADESSGTIKKRFDSINIKSTPKNRLNYREMLFRTDGVEEFISGIILYDETIKQKSALDGTPLVKVLNDRGIIAGIKVDKGTNPLAASKAEFITDGLDGLRDRLAEYYELGARFTKWRAVITIDEYRPSRYCIETNAHALARFAALSQEANLVPIVEPEVLMDGNHSIDDCFATTEATLREVYYQLGLNGVLLEGSLLKPNMVLSGANAMNRAGPEEVASKTLACFRRTVPAAVPGVVFLSGGQSDSEATANLNAINNLAIKSNAPWETSFSFGRGLQSSPLKVWGGNPDNRDAAARAYYERARLTGSARRGEY